MNTPVYEVDSQLTSKIKNYAMHDLNADLVGVANIERFEHAPKRMRPQGLMPTAKSVIVMAVHHLDATIEIGGIEHPQKMGPYSLQGRMNGRLDEMSYRMALFLEDNGFEAVPIASSNIWRYKGYKEMTEQFAPDVSHIHCAIAAGLADFGYNGLALTPEFGARQRYVTIITDAELTPTPLIEPGTICDDCMLCRKHCMSQALSKEINGWNIVKIEDKEYRYANKNLWRCSWGEHFGLDLDLELPDKVDENVVLESMLKYGKRGGEMGSCLRYCVPKKLRYFDKSYTNAPRRKRHSIQNPEIEDLHRGCFEKIRGMIAKYDLDFLSVKSGEKLEKETGIKLSDYLPDGKTAINLGLCFSKEQKQNPDFEQAKDYITDQVGYDIARELQRIGFSAILMTQIPKEKIEARLEGIPKGMGMWTSTVITSAELPETSEKINLEAPTAKDKKQLNMLVKKLTSASCDISGVAPASRIDNIVEQLSPYFDGEELIIGRDTAIVHLPVIAETEKQTRKLKKPSDYVENAKSVIVMGLRVPGGSVDCTGRYDAEAVGPYAFAQYESNRLLAIAGLKLINFLEKQGFKAAMTNDLVKTASFVGNPRGLLPDAFSNRFAAVAAGLGRLTKAGYLKNSEFGVNMRYVAIITDAELPCNPVETEELAEICAECGLCESACANKSFGDKIALEVEGVKNDFLKIDANRCDWCKRYSLTADAGNQFMGWKFNEPLPEKITEENLKAALDRTPPIQKHLPCNFEKCLMACPYARKQDAVSCSA